MTLLKKEKIAIIGSGPIGSILAAYLIKSGLEVIIVNSGKRFDQIKKNGLVISGKENFTFHPTSLYHSIDQLKEVNLKSVFICTKTYSLDKLLPELSKVLTNKTTIISCQNGIGPEEKISKYFPQNGIGRIILNFAGSIIDSEGTVNINWVKPPNIIASFQKINKELLHFYCDKFNQAGLATEVVSKEELFKQSFIKTTLNASLSPLCTINSLTMNEAMNGCLRPIVCQTLSECISLAEKINIDLGKAPVDTLLLDYLKNGGNHYPSMWNDLHNNRPSEIEYLNLKIIQLAQNNNLVLPLNLMLTSMIIAKEIQLNLRDENNTPKEIYMMCQTKCSPGNIISDKRKDCYNYLVNNNHK